jgi:hypothetical protein
MPKHVGREIPAAGVVSDRVLGARRRRRVNPKSPLHVYLLTPPAAVGKTVTLSIARGFMVTASTDETSGEARARSLSEAENDVWFHPF